MKTLSTILFTILITTTFAQIKPEMIQVSGGSFNMGNPYTDKSRYGENDEKPVHKVTVNDFYIGKYEITISQYKAFLADNYTEFDKYGVRHHLPKAPDSTWWQGHVDTKKYWSSQVKKWWGLNNKFPIFKITWYEAIAYCNWLSKKEKLQPCYSIIDRTIKIDLTKNGYRLPTEAEWEFAARGGNKSKNTRFSGSNNFNEVAWVDDNTLLTGPKTIGTKKPNELGIYDMSGNVWEWCSDYYSPFFYKNSKNKKNPFNNSPTGYRTIRGGSWHYRVNLATIYTRDGPKPAYANYNYGFRIARNK